MFLRGEVRKVLLWNFVEKGREVSVIDTSLVL